VRLALAHDALVTRGGAERVAAVLCEAFPDAPLYTSVYLPERTYPAFRSVDVRPSALQGLVRSERTLKALFPLALWAMERQVLKGFDVVLSSSSFAGKFVRVSPGTVHVSYCYTPFRLAWDGMSYRQAPGGPLVRLGLEAAGALIRPWDRRAAARVDHFVAMTETTRARIQSAYGRDSLVVPPPIDCTRFWPEGPRSNRFLAVSRLEPYKRVDVLVKAFNQLGEPLCIVGAGSQRGRLRALAESNIEFRSDVPDDELRNLYATARALIMPQEEDYGLVALEALASGTPVIAYGAGGARETMIPAGRPDEAPRATALFFAEQTAEAVVAAVHAFADYNFQAAFLRAHAERFDKAAFIARLRSIVDSVYPVTRRNLAPSSAPPRPASSPVSSRSEPLASAWHARNHARRSGPLAQGRGLIPHRLGRLTLQSGTLAELLSECGDQFHHVVTVNAEIFVLAHENAAYGHLLHRTTNVIDGRIVQQLVRLRNLAWDVRRLPGSVEIYSLAAHCRATGERLFILGASEEVNAGACARLRTLYPGLAIAGYAPAMTTDLGEGTWSEEAVARIRRFRANYLGVCLGSPREGFWIDAHAAELAAAGVRLALGLGGTADFVAGAKPRAPRVMDWLGLEWLFRALWEPRRRWKRTLSMFRMPWYVLLPPSG